MVLPLRATKCLKQLKRSVSIDLFSLHPSYMLLELLIYKVSFGKQCLNVAANL